ncbi:MAG TPA: type II toxin-antitoxin system VapC family toxin [Gammaproteobacteria bacterium]
MFVDASAIVAMMTDENDARKLATRLEASKARLTSVIALFEATAGIARVLALPVAKAQEEVANFLELMEIDVVAVPAEVGPIAIDAFARFGKGRRHAAQLNMGDCFAYGCARHYKQPLLFTGSDFSKTDIEQA